MAKHGRDDCYYTPIMAGHGGSTSLPLLFLFIAQQHNQSNHTNRIDIAVAVTASRVVSALPAFAITALLCYRRHRRRLLANDHPLLLLRPTGTFGPRVATGDSGHPPPHPAPCPPCPLQRECASWLLSVSPHLHLPEPHLSVSYQWADFRTFRAADVSKQPAPNR